MIYVLVFFLLILALFLIYVARSPSAYFIARAITINRPAEDVFPYINNSKLMEKWSPWKEIDPKVEMNYSGPDEGVGSKASWDSLGKMGTGSATIIESTQNKTVRTQLEYVKPFKMNQEAEITIIVLGHQSTVQWAVRGHNSFMGRLACSFFNMDKMVGGNFETGLKKLKLILE